MQNHENNNQAHTHLRAHTHARNVRALQKKASEHLQHGVFVTNRLELKHLLTMLISRVFLLCQGLFQTLF